MILKMAKRPKQDGEDNHRAKLTRAMVRTIRERYAEGDVSFPQLAREYGVHHTTIMRAVRGDSWR